jgi:hypothetical protein
MIAHFDFAAIVTIQRQLTFALLVCTEMTGDSLIPTGTERVDEASVRNGTTRKPLPARETRALGSDRRSAVGMLDRTLGPHRPWCHRVILQLICRIVAISLQVAGCLSDLLEDHTGGLRASRAPS